MGGTGRVARVAALAILVASAALTAACAAPGGGASDADTARATDTTRAVEPGGPVTSAMLQELEREARALARTEGCGGAAQCATVPVGAKACGGPRTHLVYCPATTDTAALNAKLRELAEAEEEYNRVNQIASDCMFVGPPEVESVGGICRAVQTP